MLGLDAEDQKVVDWIMQSMSHGQSKETSGWAVSPSVADDRRLYKVGILLDLLGTCPPCDPPQNLAARTLQKIEAHRAAPILFTSPINPTAESLEA